MKHRYDAEVNLHTATGEFVTVYPDVVGPAGMSAPEIHAAAERAALAEVPGGTIAGSAVSTTGERC